MSKKRRKPRRRVGSGSNAEPRPPHKRRLPAPHMPGQHRPKKRPDDEHIRAEAQANPYVQQIAAQIDHVAAASGLNKFTILSDWLGMMEASLRMWAQNMKAVAMTGQFVEDPPDIQAVFATARARYLRASAQYPAAYRKMQQAFAMTFALLMESAAPGLEHYARQTEHNPDVIGQVFLTCLEPGPLWTQFFSSWESALRRAREAVPDGAAQVYLRLTEAALAARVEGQAIQLEPGENFTDWFATIQPYVQPFIFDSPPVDSSVMMLAVAAQFRPWMVELKLVEVYWTTATDPLLARMARLNAMLYNLNGYLLEYVEAGAEIEAYLQQQEAEVNSSQMATALRSPSAVFQSEPPQGGPEQAARPASSPSTTPAGRSFADLFRDTLNKPEAD